MGNSLADVTIPASVTEIGEAAFDNNNTLSSVVIEGTPTIEDYAFDRIASTGVIYCQTGHAACEGKGADVAYYQKQRGKEATRLSKPTGNTFMIRYK